MNIKRMLFFVCFRRVVWGILWDEDLLLFIFYSWVVFHSFWCFYLPPFIYKKVYA